MRTVVGFPDYQVSETGCVYSTRRNYAEPRPLRFVRDRDGYLGVRLQGSDGATNWRHVHRVVLEAYVGPRPDDQVARHLNGNKTDNRLENLTWGLQQDNVDDRDRHGTTASGSRNGQSKLTLEEAQKIRALSGTSKEIAAVFGVSDSCVRDIKNKRTWR